MAKHRQAKGNELHVDYFAFFADDAAFAAGTIEPGVSGSITSAANVDKCALVRSSGRVYRLTDPAPTWALVSDPAAGTVAAAALAAAGTAQTDADDAASAASSAHTAAINAATAAAGA